MYWVGLIIFPFAISADSSDQFSKDIFAYFDSELVDYLRQEWGAHREAMENSIALTMQETIGAPGLNVFPVIPTVLRLADAYYHDHGQVHIIFSDMDLMDLPKCWLPHVSLSLSSNVLKIEAPLTKMIITANYNLMRNKSDIVTNVNQQDSFKISPFLFHQVPNMGKVAFSVDGCILSGYVMTKLKGESINLGHEGLSLSKCRYTMEIYKDGSGHPPIITQFSATKALVSLEIKHLLLKPIKEDFILKLQAALFSTVNTTAIFGQKLGAAREAQEAINVKCSHGLNKIIRGLNQKVINTNGDVANIDDFIVVWDDTPSNNNGPERIQLSNMVLTGLGTAYNSHTGGPYKLDEVMIGERVVYSTLQVRGIVSYTSGEEDHYKFSVEISDFAINVDIGVQDFGESSKGTLVGFRQIEFAMPGMINNPVAKFITGYLINELPSIVINAMSVNLNPKLMHSGEATDIENNRRNNSAKLEKKFFQNSDEDIHISTTRYLKDNSTINVERDRSSTHTRNPDSLTSNNEIVKD